MTISKLNHSYVQINEIFTKKIHLHFRTVIGVLPFTLDAIHKEITIYILEYYTSHLIETNADTEEINALHNQNTKE